MTIAQIMGVVAGVALAFGLFRLLLSDPDMPWWAAGGFLLVYLLVAILTLGFAVLPSQRLRSNSAALRSWP